MSKSLSYHENIIIGGGPAGSATAILLARAGRDVAIFEKHEFPHEKVCGDFLSWEACTYLEKLGIDLAELGAQRIRAARLYNGNQSLEFSLPFTACSLSRKRLDETLLKRAEDAGATLYRGSNIKDLYQNYAGWTVSTSNNYQCHAKNIYLANGKHDLHGWSRSKTHNHLIGFKMHFRLTKDQNEELKGHTELFYFNGGYAGLQLIENDLANLCLLVKKDVYISIGSKWEKLLGWLSKHNPYLLTRLQDSSPQWDKPLTIYRVPYGYFRKSNGTCTNFFPLGDQVAVIPSFAGDGISIALHSAFLNAEAVLSDSSANYQKRTKEDFVPLLRKARIAEQILVNDKLRKPLFALLKNSPRLAAFISRSLRVKGLVDA